LKAEPAAPAALPVAVEGRGAVAAIFI